MYHYPDDELSLPSSFGASDSSSFTYASARMPMPTRAAIRRSAKQQAEEAKGGAPRLRDPWHATGRCRIPEFSLMW